MRFRTGSLESEHGNENLRPEIIARNALPGAKIKKIAHQRLPEARRLSQIARVVVSRTSATKNRTGWPRTQNLPTRNSEMFQRTRCSRPRSHRHPCGSSRSRVASGVWNGMLLDSLPRPNVRDQARSTAKRLRSASEQWPRAPSCVARKTTRGAWPASSASCQRGAQRHQRSPGFRPRKPNSGIGVERSLPRDFENSRNGAVMTAQTVWLPMSSRPVAGVLAGNCRYQSTGCR